jgi:TatD DNase family protein
MIDSHCHLADDAFVDDLEEVTDRAKAAGLNSALCILDTTNPLEAKRFQRVVEAWPSVRCATGVHPHQAGQYRDREDDVESAVARAIAELPQACAVGEIGLDYHYDFAPRELQQEVFRRQVRLAREQALPVVIHTREADADTVAILREEGGGEVRGVFHCFAGDVDLARQALDLGFYVSFSGIVTFRRAEEIRAAAKLVPADRLLAETDSPYLAPTPYRGKRNEPAWVARVVEVLAETRGELQADVAAGTAVSFVSLFGDGSQRP